MHESRMVADLVARAEEVAAESAASIERMTLRIGAMSGIPADAIRRGVEELAAARWGRRPEVRIEHSTDLLDPNALGVVLVSVAMEAPTCA